jgi:hypothetical protein
MLIFASLYYHYAVQCIWKWRGVATAGLAAHADGYSKAKVANYAMSFGDVVEKVTRLYVSVRNALMMDEGKAREQLFDDTQVLGRFQTGERLEYFFSNYKERFRARSLTRIEAASW